jgi:molybdenum cofactor biosynthesis enzyme MoaA
MKIHNLRLGFACNSSSSHSLIFLPECDWDEGEYVGHQDFGWDRFTLGTNESKMGYLGQQIVTSLRDQLGEEPAMALAIAIAGVDIDRDGSVDHQSVWTLPKTWDESAIDTDFLHALRDYLKRDGVVVLGGNDNGGDHPLAERNDDTGEGKNFSIFGRWTDGSGRLVSRFDKGLGTWTLFDRGSGAKVRLSFEQPDGAPKIPHVDVAKASQPELVDVKVTDRCPYKCDHCYQGSTPDASHADRAFLDKLLDDLAASQVFEVAYGGGEPTTYPDFLQLLTATRARKIVPNFTTRNIGWIQKHATELTKVVGRIAFSVDTVDEIDRLEQYLTLRMDDTKSVFSLQSGDRYDALVSIQHVVGATPLDQFERLIKLINKHYLDLTLLGWKTTGRGGSGPPHDVDWASCLKIAKMHQVQIDTALARASDMSSVDKRTYHLTEGSVSCYVDGVTQRIGPSSYASSLVMRPYTSMENDWARVRVEHGV